MEKASLFMIVLLPRCRLLSISQMKLTANYATSSHEWLERQRKDPYVKKAKFVSYRARSAFKLLEIDEKHRILKPGQVVIDIGACPGSWCQVAVAKVKADESSKKSFEETDPLMVTSELAPNPELQNWYNKDRNSPDSAPLQKVVSQEQGLVIGIDLLPMEPLRGATFISDADFTSPKSQDRILKILGGREVDVVLSDMAPNSTGIREMDHDLIIRLCTSAFEFSRKVLKHDGTFLCKIWAGRDQTAFAESLKKYFNLVRFVKPPASRGDSAEIYILATKFQKLQNE